MQTAFVKDHLYFFVVFTLLEISFTALYYLLVKTVDRTIVIGAALYAGAMMAGYVSYRNVLYRKQRKDLLDALP